MGVASFAGAQRRLPSFGEKLRKLRKRHKLTQQQLAAQLGYNAHSTIVMLERGQIQPTVDLLLKLKAQFGVSADQLISDDLDLE